MKLLFVHGWGFDAGLWDAVIAHLPDADVARVDRGYFGAETLPDIAGPCLAVTHSFGAMALLADPPADCRGLLAINGFDRFAQSACAPGVPRRVLDRMLARLDGNPNAVLGDFHARLGSRVPRGEPETSRLRRDLLSMRDGDCRETTAQWNGPIVALDGMDDPLLPDATRTAQFDRAARLERATVRGGHLLPLTHPALCAARIENMRGAA